MSPKEVTDVQPAFATDGALKSERDRAITHTSTHANARARVVLVGTGRMGQIRAGVLYANPRVELCGIVDVDFFAAKKLSAKYSTKPFSTLKDAIGLYGTRASQTSTIDNVNVPPTALDGVIISSPTFTHESIITEAAKSGLYIFVEKPVDETADKIRKIFEFCNTSGAVLCCGFQRRFDASYVATRNSVAGGRVGQPLMSTVFFADHPAPPMEFMLSGGNIFMDLLPHDLDYMRWCLNDDVASVYSTGTSSTEELEKAGVHDNATVVMKFKKGTVVTFMLSRSATYGYDQRCEVFGSKGLITVGNKHANTSVLSDDTGFHSSLLQHSFPQRFNEAFAAEVDAFCHCIVDHCKWPITEEDCVAVQKIIDAARLSCQLNTVIEL